MIRLRKPLHRIVAMLVTIVMLFMTTGCNTSTQQSNTKANNSSAASGNVVIFTPSDGISLTRNTPLSTWDSLVPEIVKSLKSHGFNESKIELHSSSSLHEQSQSIQDYVVNKIEKKKEKSIEDNSNNKKIKNKNKDNKDNKDSQTTIIVAPFTNKNGNNNYGDYATQPEDESYLNSKIEEKTKQKSNKKPQNVKDSKDSKDSQDSKNNENYEESNDKKLDYEAENRISTSLKLAQKSGIHVIVLSRMIKNFEPDALVNFSTAERIGEAQAKALVEKLALYRATSNNPKSIEVLLPCNQNHFSSKNENSENSENTKSSEDEKDTKNNKDSNDEYNTDEFAHHAFIGIWRILQPYFSEGTLVSPSGKLNAKVTDQDWSNVAFYANNADSVKKELSKRLVKHEGILEDKYVHIDGIIALDDNTASKTEKTLTDFGYKGSAADINPSITIKDVIGNIIGNIIGKRNLNKQPVPQPHIKSNKNNKNDSNNKNDLDTDTNSKNNNSDESNKNDNSTFKWPIITGYGAYKYALPNIVNGKQWITTIEHKQEAAFDIAKACKELNQTGKLEINKRMSTIVINNKQIALYTENILAVSATNLKARLIDPGYVSLADAGL